jgi:ATP-binding cassette subfamily B protein
MGDSMGQFYQGVGSFFGGMVLAFYYGPVVAVICFAFIPAFLIVVMLLGIKVKIATFKKMEAIKVLGGFTEECLHSLKLIVSFAQEKHIIETYNTKAEVCHDVSNVTNRL